MLAAVRSHLDGPQATKRDPVDGNADGGPNQGVVDGVAVVLLGRNFMWRQSCGDASLTEPSSHEGLEISASTNCFWPVTSETEAHSDSSHNWLKGRAHLASKPPSASCDEPLCMVNRTILACSGANHILLRKAAFPPQCAIIITIVFGGPEMRFILALRFSRSRHAAFRLLHHHQKQVVVEPIAPLFK